MGEHHPAKWGGDEGKRSVQARTVNRPARVPPTRHTEPEGPEASDAAKALAASEGIDLRDVVATGATGITKADVERTIAEQQPPEPPPAETPAREDVSAPPAQTELTA